MCTIAVKELFPILLTAAMYGKHWKGCSILCRCDNQAVVAVVRSRYAANDRLMHLLRVLFFLEAQYNFHLMPKHIAGNHNTLADHISCNRHSAFLPLSQDTLCNFAAFLARQNIKQTTLKVYLSALRYYQVGQGFAEPNHAAMGN